MSLSRFERELLASAPREAPSAASRARAHAAMRRAAGLAVGAGIATTATKAAASAKGGPTATAAVKGVSLAKIALLASLGVAGAGGAVVATRAVTAPPPPLVASAPAAGQATNGNIDVTTGNGSDTNGNIDVAAKISHDPAIAPSALPDVPATASASPKPPPAVEDPLRVEARLLEDARAALARGDATSAAARLAEHHARFPTGLLADEADLLAIDVARARADRSAAHAAAQRLLARHPSGPYAARAKAALGDDTFRDRPAASAPRNESR